MSILKELENQHGGQKELAKKAGVLPSTLCNAHKSNNVVGYTYNLAKRINGSFKLQIIEDGYLITVSREKI